MNLNWLLFFSLSMSVAAWGQNPAGLIRQAETRLAQGKPAEAAALFERAGRLKASDPALMYQAGEAYFQVRDYPNAANCYQAVGNTPDFPLAGFRYARCLKQQGQYQLAVAAFQRAWESYQGNKRALVLQVANNEIAGCQLALAQDSVQTTRINWLPSPVATPENEFAPLPFSDTLLYFTQPQDKQNRLMRCARQGQLWQLPVEAKGLPPAAAQGFLSGTFSADGQRFYFVKSQSSATAVQRGSAQATSGAIYALQRDADGNWGEPQKLRAYINLEGSANLWPFVCEYGSEEWLFFSSNRAGGVGGFDLYVCKRLLNSPELDFTFPLNLGEQINTGADEITPFYDVFTQTLWFSSLGHPSLGGMDVFQATGQGNNWNELQNAGKPINSPADDYFFVLKRDGSGAFLSSNRRVEGLKDQTTDDDLFEVIYYD